MRQGYVIVWSGWDVTAAPGANHPSSTVPVAKNPDGSSITGPTLPGIRFPENAAPLVTYTGWALRAGPAADDGCDARGQQIPFAQTQAEPLAKGAPRLSLEQCFLNHDGYVGAVRNAVYRLMRQRFLTGEDGFQYINAAEAGNVLI